MTTPLPLAGVRILAIEQYGAGPYASMYLADLGAEVIKIENTAVGGDVSRQTGPYFLGDNDSEFFQTFNLNKRSLGLDLKAPEGQALFKQLVAKSHGVLNNLRGDQPDKLGLTYQALKEANPEIVCAHLSAYGRDNDRASWPGYDYLMQAEAGLMSLTGDPANEPCRLGVSMVDFMTGSVTALGMVSGILGAKLHGVGRDVDVSLFDVALHQLSYPATWYLNQGHQTLRSPRSAHPTVVPCQLYRCADGYLFIMAMTDKFWQALVSILDDSRLTQADFATLKGRQTHKTRLNNLLDEIFSQHNVSHWLKLCQGELPCAPVSSLAQALDSPFVAATGMRQQMRHPASKPLTMLANPIKLDSQRLPGKVANPLAADTPSILTELGYSESDIADLAARGVIGIGKTSAEIAAAQGGKDEA